MSFSEKRMAFEIAADVRQCELFYFDDNADLYVAVDSIMQPTVDDINEAYGFWSAAWGAAILSMQIENTLNKTTVC